MELGLALGVNLFIFSLLTILLVALSIDEARKERKVRERKTKEVKKAA